MSIPPRIQKEKATDGKENKFRRGLMFSGNMEKDQFEQQFPDDGSGPSGGLEKLCRHINFSTVASGNIEHQELRRRPHWEQRQNPGAASS